MDFKANGEQRKQQKSVELGGLIEQRYASTMTIESHRNLIEELDLRIAGLQSAVAEIDQSQRDFDAYKAVEAARPDETGAIDGGAITPDSEPT